MREIEMKKYEILLQRGKERERDTKERDTKRERWVGNEKRLQTMTTL